MPKVEPVQYLENEDVWLMSAKPDWHCEIIISGDAAGPAPPRLAFLHRIISKLGDLEKQAADYLDLFVDRHRFAKSEAWYLDSCELGRDPSTPASEFTLHFSLESDVYGGWTVTLQEHGTQICAVAFARQQL